MSQNLEIYCLEELMKIKKNSNKVRAIRDDSNNKYSLTIFECMNDI